MLPPMLEGPLPPPPAGRAVTADATVDGQLRTGLGAARLALVGGLGLTHGQPIRRPPAGRAVTADATVDRQLRTGLGAARLALVGG